LKPDPLLRAASVLESHGKEVAEHVASFEARQVEAIRELVALENIDCNFEETMVMDVCMYPEGRDKMKASIDKTVKEGISTAKTIKYFTGKEAENVSGVHGALSCHTYHAARLSPYRLVTRLLEKAISAGVDLQTFTPVAGVTAQQDGSGEHRWLVETLRGSVKAKTVIYATNGYTAALVPEMKDKIVPVRGTVARLSGAKAPKMNHSYMMRISAYEYDYMIPLPDNSIVVGGAKRDFYKHRDQWYNVSDDSKLIEGASDYFDGYMQRHFHGWEDSGASTKQVWTGSKYPRSNMV
jgi:glycine/D-amino acid oxidase-like deaminating enzyme